MKVDVVIIGSGQAGVPLAARLAGAGRKVVLAERKALGGTCVNYGCTPTKTMVASARAAHVARTAGRLGVSAAGVKVSVQNGDRTDAYGGSGAPVTRVRVAVSFFNNAADIQRMLSAAERLQAT